MSSAEPTQSKRLLILASKLGYQTRGFAEAARKLGVEVLFGTDRCSQLDDPWQDGAIPLRFENAEAAAKAVLVATRGKPVDAVLALGDRPTAAAAYAARELGLAYNAPEAVEVCRSKLRQREVLRAAGLPVPDFFSFSREEDPGAVLPQVKFPCVVKPLSLAASQGVIRADNPEEFVRAVQRIKALLETPEIQVTREPELDRVLVEGYVPGDEVAIEGLLDQGQLRLLAIFDKPEALEGPFFEETIYVTPSRLPSEIQARIVSCAQSTIRALRLSQGPVHAEFRINAAGAWVIEVAPRPIGGLCSRALRFGLQRIFLEELLVRHVLGLEGSEWEREPDASGVMMIPVPRSGIFERAEGIDEAYGTCGVEEIHITARPHDYIAAWPEGSSYLGFIFARGARAEEVERALREAHARLRFVITPRLPVEHPLRGQVPVSDAPN
jgi:biotin carboxylase